MLNQDLLRQGLVRYCTKLLSNAHDAEEAAQDVMLRFLQGGRTKAMEVDKRLMYASARNRCFDMLRARKRTPIAVSFSDHPARQDPDSDLQDALMLLPALEREALLLTAVEDVDFRSAAKLMNVSLGLISKLRFQAVEHMRRLLNRY
jgi:RNA polymerase sigma-70 factor (ECF subfamily)